ncbi:Glycoside hydrolase [Mycena indigotica]|uniref:Glycoside hydrolase n=1 Tax=Mycena indigotica TaxID=2126181 RepID=A0A8H6T6N8_9AGAR|nr:Glycoside hydrolase [Mycena indigotica]KAF7311931.1 Glycoside hydrolase [Mycena indigotica]
MVRFAGALVSLLSALVALVGAVPLGLNATLGARADGLSPLARDLLLSSRAVPATRWVAYFDKYVSYNSLPSPAQLNGFNVFALAFIYSGSLQDNAALWGQFDAATRASIKSQYAAAGISLIVSAYGAGPNPTSAGDDPTAAANYIANFVKSTGLDGVDVDYEDFGALETSGTAVAWLSTFTRALRAQLPQGQYIITHAPVAPWFTPNIWPGNGYLGVHQQVGSLIDWYNVQFYNQGSSEYTTCSGLLTSSSSQWPQSSVFQIAANGVPLNKIVIGKPGTTADATNGYMDPGTLAACLAQAKNQGWSAGAMTWQYPNADSGWITTVRSQSFPVGGGGGGGGEEEGALLHRRRPQQRRQLAVAAEDHARARRHGRRLQLIPPAQSCRTAARSGPPTSGTITRLREAHVTGAWTRTATCNGALHTVAVANAATAHPAIVTKGA